jgi:mRNA-degrading endonuclease RelE of RelBE toxin-antitoxin system
MLPTVVETSVFARKAEKLLTADEHEDLLFYLSAYYAAGDEIHGTGGVRKIRYATGGRGKSGGVRVIYYFFDEVNPKEKKLATSLAGKLKAEAKARRKEQ